MNKLISGYLWAWTNYEAGFKSVNSLKKFYPNADIFINVDYDGDIANYTDICDKNGFTFSRNNFQLGYCGNFTGKDVGYDCWPKENTFEWIRGIYEACLKTDSKYMLLLEEDDFVLKESSILKEEFSMAIHPTVPSPIGRMRPNNIPNEYIMHISDKGGNPVSPGYAAGGGTFFNREQFIKAWETHKDSFWNDYDYLAGVNKIIGWADYILQFIMQLDGCEIIQNDKLAEHWEVGDKWNQFEIITGMKDKEIIKSL
jgi:hypothetical protein